MNQNSNVRPASASEVTRSATYEPGALGVTHCSGCGESIALVGALRDDGITDGQCEFCSKKYELATTLDKELAGVIQAWIASCERRKISTQLVSETLEGVDMLAIGTHPSLTS